MKNEEEVESKRPRAPVQFDEDFEDRVTRRAAGNVKADLEKQLHDLDERVTGIAKADLEKKFAYLEQEFKNLKKVTETELESLKEEVKRLKSMSNDLEQAATEVPIYVGPYSEI